MNNKIIISIVGVCVVVLAILVFFSQNPSPKNTYQENSVVASSSQEAAQGNGEARTFTLQQVAEHNNKESCYTAIRGSVYDLTGWIYKHPGGAGRILKLCGIDGTEPFVGKHGGERRPEEELAEFKIGELIKQ